VSFEVPETQFTNSGGRSIAFQVCGSGELDLVFTPGSFNHVDVWWEHPVTLRFLRGLASFSRLILFDRRGTGASDPLPSDEQPDWQEWVADLEAVLDATRSTRPAIFASLDGGSTALAFAANAPERVTKLVLYNTTARFRAAPDYPCGVSDESADSIITALRDTWGTLAFSTANYPDRLDDSDFLRWYAKYQRASIRKGSVEAIARAWLDTDARAFARRVEAPTLVLHREQHRMLPVTHAAWLAENMRNAHLQLMPGGSALFATDAETVIDHVSRFLTGKAAAMTYVPPDKPTVGVAGYELVECIGRGGMGEVWSARKPLTGERVAIKLVRISSTGELRRRLQREAETTAAVKHPGVVAIRDVAEASDGSPAIVMDLLEGETLADKLSREGRLDEHECARILLPIISAVGTAHSLGIIHRDLKPANVFLARVNGEEHVKVLDFGIAKVLGETQDHSKLTATGALLGTPAYMSPEQLAGEGCDHRADIWAIALIAFEMLTSTLPTRANHLGQILKIIAASTGWEPRSLVPSIPDALNEGIAHMLAKDPDERPADLRQVFALVARYTTVSTPEFGAPLSRRGELNRA
jgi:eukaryotic-like serine/threonine-protein kinase